MEFYQLLNLEQIQKAPVTWSLTKDLQSDYSGLEVICKLLALQVIILTMSMIKKHDGSLIIIYKYTHISEESI